MRYISGLWNRQSAFGLLTQGLLIEIQLQVDADIAEDVLSSTVGMPKARVKGMHIEGERR